MVDSIALINARGFQTNFAAVRGQYQIAVIIKPRSLRRVKLKGDRIRICPRCYLEVIFKLTLVAVVHQINSRIDGLIANPGKLRDVAMPLVWIVADEIVALAPEADRLR